MLNVIVKVVPRIAVEQMIRGESSVPRMPWALISIYTEPKEHLLTSEAVKALGSHLKGNLSLAFGDTTPAAHAKYDEVTQKRVPLFTQQQALDTINFIRQQHEKGIDMLLIHCNAGVARSGAVGVWAAMALNLNVSYFGFIQENPYIYPNTYITSMLRRADGMSPAFMGGPPDVTEEKIDYLHGRLDEGFEIVSGLQQPRTCWEGPPDDQDKQLYERERLCAKLIVEELADALGVDAKVTPRDKT